MNESEQEAIEQGFISAVSGLYRSLFDSIVTHPDPDEAEKAGKRFHKGLGAARRAKAIALENLK